MGKLYLGTQEITPFVYDKADDIGIPREISQSGVYQMPSNLTTYTLPTGVTDLGDYALYYAFMHNSTITSLDWSSLTSISGLNAAAYAFNYCSALVSADLSGLTTISGERGLVGTFYGSAASPLILSSVDLSSLTTISGLRGMQSCFGSCTSLTSVGGSSASVDLSNLTTISGQYGMQSCFYGCTGITTVAFPSLAELTETGAGTALQTAFRDCTSLTSVSFPSLSTFGYTSVNAGYFNNMLQGCTGVTVHFPAAIQSTIGSWNDVVNKFGGTNITVLYDL